MYETEGQRKQVRQRDRERELEKEGGETRKGKIHCD